MKFRMTKERCDDRAGGTLGRDAPGRSGVVDRQSPASPTAARPGPHAFDLARQSDGERCANLWTIALHVQVRSPAADRSKEAGLWPEQ